MRTMKYNDEEVKILSATGYHDGYYWDMNIVIEYKGDIYTIIDAGSSSGWYLAEQSISKSKLERLYGEEQIEVEENEFELFEYAIKELLDRFINNGATESYEYTEVDEPGREKIFVDGIEMEDEEND